MLLTGTKLNILNNNINYNKYKQNRTLPAENVIMLCHEHMWWRSSLLGNVTGTDCIMILGHIQGLINPRRPILRHDMIQISRNLNHIYHT